MIWKTLGFQVAAVAAVAAALVWLAPLGAPDSPAPAAPGIPPRPAATAPQPYSDAAGSFSTPQPEQYRTAAPLWSGGPEHDPQENAAHPWQKHASEFRELHSERDYTNAAHDFVNHPPPGAQTKQDRRGDTLIYDPGSNTFAVRAPDGAPRTMFRPHNGAAYWDRQR